jgi:hypothetical protein
LKKLSQNQLKRYLTSQEAKVTKGHIVVDELHRKNLQAWIPFELWTKIKDRVESERTSMNKYIEHALATYLLLEDEDLERIVARHAE